MLITSFCFGQMKTEKIRLEINYALRYENRITIELDKNGNLILEIEKNGGSLICPSEEISRITINKKIDSEEYKLLNIEIDKLGDEIRYDNVIGCDGESVLLSREFPAYSERFYFWSPSYNENSRLLVMFNIICKKILELAGLDIKNYWSK